MKRLLNFLLGGLLAALAASCGGAGQPPADALTEQAGDQSPAPGQASFDIGVPRDSVQPGETLTAAGWVVRAEAARAASAAPADYFTVGRDRFLEDGLVADNGEATSLAGFDGNLSYAIYRIALGGELPGAVDVDANSPAPGAYYVGLADFNSEVWHWRGPFTDNFTRIECRSVAEPADLRSSLGNIFICVVAGPGAYVDVVGAGVALAIADDTEAPAAPASLVLEPYNRALLVRWPDVGDDSLAGYRVYWCSQWFHDGEGTGVRRTSSLVPGGEYLISGISGTQYVRVQTVDVSGNASPISEISFATPINQSPLQLAVEASSPSAVVGQQVTISASGADWYDFDFDSDGELDQINIASGNTQQDTSSPGLSRVAIWGRSADGLGLSRAGLSILVVDGDQENGPPAAYLQVSQAIADQGSDIELDASASFDSDGSIVLYEFDFDGDRFFEWSSPGQSVVTHAYAAPGIYQPTVRVTDEDGARDTASKQVRVNEVFGVPQPWPLRGGNPRRNGLSPYSGPQSNHERWSFTAGSFIRSSPAIGADGTIYFGCDDDYLYAVTPAGGLKWKYPTGGNVSSSPAIAPNGVIYVGSWDGKLYAITAKGIMVWAYPTEGPVASSPVVGADGTVYVGSSDGHVYAVSPSGELRWRFATGGLVVSSPALATDGTIYVGSKDMKAYAITPQGKLKWEFQTGEDVDASPVVGPDGTVYVGSWDRYLYALSPAGELRWSFRTGASIDASPAIAPDGSIYVCSRNHKLYALKPDGSFKWEYITGDGIASSPAVGRDGLVYFGSADDQLYALEPGGGLKWSLAAGGDVDSSPALGADGTLFVGCLDFKLYAVGP